MCCGEQAGGHPLQPFLPLLPLPLLQGCQLAMTVHLPLPLPPSLQCAAEGCTSCPAGPGVCGSCAERVTLQGGACGPCQDPRCMTCDSSGPATCDICDDPKSEYGVDKATGKCVKVRLGETVAPVLQCCGGR